VVAPLPLLSSSNELEGVKVGGLEIVQQDAGKSLKNLQSSGESIAPQLKKNSFLSAASGG